MDNDLYFNKIKNMYDSLKYFSLENNKLFFNFNNEIKKIQLNNVKLNQINENIFLLNPNDLWNVLKLLELVPYLSYIIINNKNEDVNLINAYLQTFWLINKKYIENEFEKDIFLDVQKPLLLAYDERYNNSVSEYIRSSLEKLENDYMTTASSSKKNGPILRLVPNDTISEYHENEDNIFNNDNFGYTSIMLVSILIIGTILYILYFIAK